MREWLIKLGRVIAIGWGNFYNVETTNDYYTVGLSMFIIACFCFITLIFIILYLIICKKGEQK